MKKLRLNLVSVILLSMLMTGLSGCGAGPSSPGRFYVLSTPASISASQIEKDKNITIGVGPVTLPPHLDRTQTVTQTSEYQLALNELDQWAEPLVDGITRVLSQNIGVLLGTDSVLQFPWRKPFSVQYQVSVNILRFDTDASGRSVFHAQWSVLTEDGKELLFSHASTFVTQVSGEGFEPIVAAMNHNLAELSREISTAIHTFK